MAILHWKQGLLCDKEKVTIRGKGPYPPTVRKYVLGIALQGLYSPTILKNILYLFPQDSVNLNVTQLLIG